MPKSVAERLRAYHARKRAQAPPKVKKTPKTGAQRVREFRERKKALKAGVILSVLPLPTQPRSTDVLVNVEPSTSNNISLSAECNRAQAPLKVDSYPSADGDELSAPVGLEVMDGRSETSSELLENDEAIIGDIKMERGTSEDGDNPILHIDIKEDYTLDDFSWQEQDPLALSPKNECQLEFVEAQNVKTETDKATPQPNWANAGESAICQHSMTTSVEFEDTPSTNIMESYLSAGSDQLLEPASLKFMDGESENCTELLVNAIVEDNIKSEGGTSEDSIEPILDIDIKEECSEEDPLPPSPINEYMIELEENVETQNLKTRVTDETISQPKSENAGESAVWQPSISSSVGNEESTLSTKIIIPETIGDNCSIESSEYSIAQCGPSYQYLMSNEVFNKNGNLARHFCSQYTGEKPCQYRTRGKAFSDKAFLVHDRRHAGEDPYQCPNSGSFSQKSHFITHCRQHICENHYHCHICSKAFNNNANLARHMSTQHIGEKTCQCHICSKIFHYRVNFIKHFSKQHTEEKSYRCHTCSKVFSVKAYLAVHVRTHTGEKPYQCRTCNNAFSQKSHLNTHCRQHTGDKNYHCHMCSKAFNQKIDLLRHYRQHTGEKPYHCDTCCKAFSRKSHLMTHCRIHTGEKPYQCHICSKRFNQMSKLTRHCRKHTGEKPYQCPTCSIAFNDKTNLKRHCRQHAGKKPYKCPTCSVAFVDRSSLKRHCRQHTS